jgi:hypothetical protein
MIQVLKDTYEFYEYRKTSKRLLVFYGAGRIGMAYRELMHTYHYRADHMSPDFFCDRRANEIINVETGRGKNIKVMSPKEIIDIGEDVDILITMMNSEVEWQNIFTIFATAAFNVTLGKVTFACNGAAFRIGAKVVIFDALGYSRNYFEIIRSAHSCRNAYSPEQLTAATAHPSGRIVDGKLMLSDMESTYVNCRNGVRKTSFARGVYEHRIWFFGDSRTFGVRNEDNYTYCSRLQKLINGDPRFSFEVINHGCSAADYARMYHSLTLTDIVKGDIVCFAHSFYFPNTEILFLRDARDFCEARGTVFVFVYLPSLAETCHSDEEKVLNKLFMMERFADDTEKISVGFCGLAKQQIMYVDLREALLRRNRAGRDSFFVDYCHFGSNGNIWIAEELFRFLHSIVEKRDDEKDEMVKSQELNEFIGFVCSVSEKNDIDAFVSAMVKCYKNESKIAAGSIVMNCNPFTKGHLHLIEQALLQCDFLYIFVVEEDRSEFPFKLRFQLVRDNVSHFANIAVIPSGKIILSQVTFPGYFGRDDSSNEIADATRDLTIFAEHVAPAMAIKKRFVGEEPFSAVTNHYNRQMKDILPRYGVDVIEIPRLALAGDNGRIISAAAVRSLMKDGNWAELREYVPEITYARLREMARVK